MAVLTRATILLALALVAWAPAPAGAQCTKHWVNPAGGSWFEPTNWSPQGVPYDFDYVCIDLNTGSFYIVDALTPALPITIAGLLVDGGSGVAVLQVGPRQFNINGPGTIGMYGRLTLQSSFLGTTSSGVLDVYGRVDLTGATVTLPVNLYGSLYWGDLCSVATAPVTSAGCQMVTDGATATASLQIESGFSNHCTVQFTSNQSRSLTVTGPLVNEVDGVIVGAGIRGKVAQGEATAVVDALVTNYGLIEAQNVPLAISSTTGGAHVNYGVVASSSAGLYFDLTDHGGGKTASSFTNQGNIRIGFTKAPMTVTIEGGTFDPGFGTVTGAGTLHLESTTVGSVAGGTLTNVTTTLELANSVVAPTGHVVNGNQAYVWGTSAVQGLLENSQGATLRLEGNDTYGSSVLTFASSFTNHGAVELVDGSLTTPHDATLVVAVPGSLVNQPTGVISARAGTGGGGRTIAAGLQNFGTVQAVSGDLTLLGGDHSHLNAGLLSAEAGTVLVNLASKAKTASSFTNQGNIRIGFTKQLSRVRIEQGTFNPDGGTITGDGRLELVSTLIGDPLGGASNLVNTTTLLWLTDSTVGEGCSVLNNGLAYVAGSNLVDGNLNNAATGELRGVGTIDAQTGSFVNAGRLAPGTSPGHLAVLGNLAQTSTATVEVEIGGRLQGTEFDWLEVSGNMQLAGTLELRLIPFDLVGGDEFTILTYGSRTGAFANVVRPVLGHELSWEFSAFSGQGVVSTICLGRELSVDLVADKDPVSVGHELHYTATASNSSPLPATLVTMRDALPSTLTFLSGPSSPGCVQLGGDVVCTIGTLPAGGTASKVIAVQPISAGDVTNTVTVELDECDVNPGDNSASVTVHVTLAQPCDANSDWVVDTLDIPVTVEHIFGTPAPGNPDCAEGGGVNAADLAALIVEIMQ